MLYHQGYCKFGEYTNFIEAQMQGFLQALLVEGFVVPTEIIFDAHAEF